MDLADDYSREIAAVEAWLTAELEPLVPEYVQWRICCTQEPVFRRWRTEEVLEFEQTFSLATVSTGELLRYRPFRSKEWTTELSPAAAAGRLRAAIAEIAQTNGFIRS